MSRDIFANHFRIIPVLDIRDGQAVHAVAGNRSHYRPLRSGLHPSSEPLEIARAYRDRLGLRELYVADLDAIEGRAATLGLLREIAGLGISLWIDLGLRRPEDLSKLLEIPRTTIIAGLETVESPLSLGQMLEVAETGRLVVSLDLFEGRPRLSRPDAWSSVDPLALVSTCVELGTTRLLILDLSRVGTSQGIGTDALLSQIARAFPGLEISVGGGISEMGEVIELQRRGVHAVLIGSALHDGRIGGDRLPPERS